MNSKVLGRTNRSFPPFWLKLHPSLIKDQEVLCALLNDFVLPCDFSLQPSLWGHFLRGWPGPCLIRGTLEYEKAQGAEHAADLVLAHLIQMLCSTCRTQIDFYFLPLLNKVNEDVIQGVLDALERAKEEGLIKYLGLWPIGDFYEVLRFWQLHDAFEVVLFSEQESSMFEHLAQSKRVGMIYENSAPHINPLQDQIQLVAVQNIEEVHTVVNHLKKLKDN